jgi:hypothetical protein
MLSSDQVHSGLAELCAAFGRPFGADDGTMVSAWKRALHDVEADEFREAVLFLTRESPKFPAPKAVREQAFRVRRRRIAIAAAQQLEADPDTPLPFCSRCNAWATIDDPWGRMRPRHADNCPGLHPADLEIQRLCIQRDAARETPRRAALALTPANGPQRDSATPAPDA